MLQEQNLNQLPAFLSTEISDIGLPISLKSLLPNFVVESIPTPVQTSKLENDFFSTKEINNPNQDKTIVILNFILKEVLPIKDRDQQKALLTYFFKSILSETQRLPVTHLAYEITTKPDNKLALHDDLYQIRPDLLQICQEAVESLVINQKEKDRYNLEKEQIENLLFSLENLFSLAPHAILSLLSQTNTEKNSESQKTKKNLEETGWKTLTTKEAFSFIQPEVKEKMKIENITGEITVGPKYLYVMPQSAVHEGNLSIIVITQPVFIPELNRFILLHDQHMAPKNWNDHEQLFQHLGIKTPAEFDKLNFAQKEKLIMEKLVALPPQYQKMVASETFFELFPEKQFLKRLKQKLTRFKIKGMEQSLSEYSELVLDVVKNETQIDPELKHTTVTKLSNFMNRVVFAGLLDVKKISTNKRISLFKHFQKFGGLEEKEFALSLKGIGFSSAVKAFDTSLLECVALSPLTSVQQLARLKMEGFNLNSLSKIELAKFIDKKRIDDWKMGSCTRCGAFNTWVGECNWCLSCELNYNSSTTKIKKPLIKNKSLMTEKNNKNGIFPDSLGSFIANLI